MTPRRLYRSSRDKMLAGVAAGMADYFEVDPTIVRILWVLSFFAGGVTLVLYVILALVIPVEPYGYNPATGYNAGMNADGTPVEGAAEGATVEGTAPDGTTWTAPAYTAGSSTGYSGYPARRRGGLGAGLWIGVLLVIFGFAALADSVFPGIGFHRSIGPLMIVAFGAVLLVASFGRRSGNRS